MEEILGNIYCILESFYGKPLSEYLWGYNCSSQDYDLDLLYNQFGMIAIITALVIPPIYYYLWNPVRHQQLKYWGLMIIAALINAIIAYCILTSDLDNGLIGDCLLYDDRGSQIIDTINILMFGVVDFILVCILFFVTSSLFKWGSKAVKHYPF